MKIAGEEKPIFKCDICEEVFENKFDFMTHRKIIHKEITKICRNFQKEHCRFDESECWYKHEKQNDEQIKYYENKCEEQYELKSQNMLQRIC